MNDALAAAGRPPVRPLSKRESEVVERLLCGDRIAVIATDLRLSQHTVRNHVKSIFRKLRIHSQSDLVAAVHGHLGEHDAPTTFVSGLDGKATECSTRDDGNAIVASSPFPQPMDQQRQGGHLSRPIDDDAVRLVDDLLASFDLGLDPGLPVTDERAVSELVRWSLRPDHRCEVTPFRVRGDAPDEPLHELVAMALRHLDRVVVWIPGPTRPCWTNRPALDRCLGHRSPAALLRSDAVGPEAVIETITAQPNGVATTADGVRVAAVRDRLGELAGFVVSAPTSATLARRDARPRSGPALIPRGATHRQVEIVDLMLRGYRVPSIAQRLGMNPETVRSQLKRLYGLLDVHSQQALLDWVRAPLR